MTRSKHTRHWLLAIGTLLVVFLSVLVYLYNRPASGEELRLVGSWRWIEPSQEFDFALTGDRRVVLEGGGLSGTWHVRGGVFRLIGDDLPREAVRMVASAGQPRGLRLTFTDDGNTVTATNRRDGRSIRWERVTAKAP